MIPSSNTVAAAWPATRVWPGVGSHTPAAGYWIQPGQRFKRRCTELPGKGTPKLTLGFISHINVAVRNERSLSSNVSSRRKGGGTIDSMVSHGGASEYKCQS